MFFTPSSFSAQTPEYNLTVLQQNDQTVNLKVNHSIYLTLAYISLDDNNLVKSHYSPEGATFLQNALLMPLFQLLKKGLGWNKDTSWRNSNVNHMKHFALNEISPLLSNELIFIISISIIKLMFLAFEICLNGYWIDIWTVKSVCFSTMGHFSVKKKWNGLWIKQIILI